MVGALPRGHNHHVAASAAMPMSPIPATMAIADDCDGCEAGSGGGAVGATAVGEDDGDSIEAPLGSVASGSALAVE